MNQGNPPNNHAQDNGVYQDGALLLHFPQGSGVAVERWIAIFLKFQTQAWHTDDTTGNVLEGGEEQPAVPHEPELPGGTTNVPDAGTSQPGPHEPDGQVRIISALVNPVGADQGLEKITLLNAINTVIDLTGWRLGDKNKNWMPLNGALAPGETKQVAVVDPVQLSNKGGIITLLNANGLKVDGVSYTSAQAQDEGVSIVF
jgi:hypothetical protein